MTTLVVARLVGTWFGDDDGLGVEELAHAGGGEFAAVAGALDAAEGQARIAGDDGVDEDGAALESGGEAALLGGVARPHGGAEAEGRVVGDGDGFVDVGDAEEHGDGAEDLFAVDVGGARDAGDDGGLVVVALADHALAAGEHAAAGLDGGLHLGVELFDDLRGGGERADLGVVRAWGRRLFRASMPATKRASKSS